MANPYITIEDALAAIAEVQPDNAADIARISQLIPVAESIIDDYCNRPRSYFTRLGGLFNISSKPIVGTGEPFLRLPDNYVANSIQSINPQIGLYFEISNGISTSLYLKSPYNEGLENIIGNLPESTRTEFYFAKNQIYIVTAKFGFLETPESIQEATRAIVQKLFNTQRGVLGQITPNGFVLERDLPLIAKTILERYKRREFEVV